MRTWFIFILLATLFVVSVHADGSQEAWLKKAQLGKYAQTSQDWKSIEKAARKEGKVVIYSSTSRIFDLQKEFKSKYGIEIVAYDLVSSIQLERYKREHKAGKYIADVLFNRETSLLMDYYVPRKMVWNFVPSDSEPFLDENEKSPFLIHRWSSRVVFYNKTLFPKKPPINSLWDLTRKEWEGNILLLDPLTSSANAYMIQTIIEHSDEMEAAYLREFGEPISYSKELLEITQGFGSDVNAGKEWFYRVLKNKPVFVSSGSTVVKKVGDVTLKKAPIGISTFSKIRKNKKGKYNAQVIFNLDPIAAITAPAALLIADQAPHPNAAKLLIRYMMNEGFHPWNVFGDFGSRSDILENQTKNMPPPSFDNMLKWKENPDFINDTRFEFMELFLSFR